ncbi:SUKH-3 domain-containing protein [Streptomyces sp. NBC_01077]|uniref:SUKH-3 domain-containing protein n=1 Tax=Streptomyces sp. NBC_01077 TaxID=2903746 RepID=UPI00386F4F89|nr:SUKH-3 domain-containing protein [Streptomyces sp. NBC_01077]
MTGVLTEAGWRPGRDAGDDAMLAVLITVTVGAELFPAAERAVREFHGLHVHPAADGGREVAAIGSVVDPREARLDVPSLNRLADSLGVRLFPFGRTDTDAPLAVDQHGRLLMLGPGGPWLLGETVHEGLTALAHGVAPVRLRAPRWRFPLPGDASVALDAAVRAALVAVYVLHSTGVYGARVLRLRATTLRGIGVVAVDEDFPLGPGSLESSTEPLIAEMTARLDATGAHASGCELTLTVPVPSGTEGPFATVECSVTLGNPAVGPALTLSAGLPTSLGPTAAVLDACAEAFAAWSGAGKAGRG